MGDLYLVRHGDARAEGDDAQRTLTRRGEEQIERIAAWAVGAGVRVNEIRHSGKTRASQTASILSRHLGISAVVASGLAPNDDPRAIALSSVPLMIVSHLPLLSRLASHLLTGDADREMVIFQNGTMARLVQTESGWRLLSLVSPDLVQSP